MSVDDDTKGSEGSIKVDDIKGSKRSIYVDGACNKLTGAYGWASVTDCKGKCLLTHYRDTVFAESAFEFMGFESKTKGSFTVIRAKFSDVVSQQCNGAELVAMVAGLQIMKAHPAEFSFLYSDSNTVVRSWSNGISNAKDPKKLKLIKQCMLLKAETGDRVKFVSGDDNVADLGFHKKKRKRVDDVNEPDPKRRKI